MEQSGYSDVPGKISILSSFRLSGKVSGDVHLSYLDKDLIRSVYLLLQYLNFILFLFSYRSPIIDLIEIEYLIVYIITYQITKIVIVLRF